MNIQEVAEKLNGVQYREEGKILTLEFCKLLRENGIVVVRGASDDLIEFDGAISDEYGADTIYLDSDGVIESECDEPDCPYFKRLLKNAECITPEWYKHDEYGWTYKTKIPHVTFDVFDDDEKYCRGIVFNLNNLKGEM